jgi:hypothetical protein
MTARSWPRLAVHERGKLAPKISLGLGRSGYRRPQHSRPPVMESRVPFEFRSCQSHWAGSWWCRVPCAGPAAPSDFCSRCQYFHKISLARSLRRPAARLGQARERAAGRGISNESTASDL